MRDLYRPLSHLLLAAALAGCGSAVVNPVTGQAERSVMSEQAEVAEGASAHKQVLQEYGVVRDARLREVITLALDPTLAVAASNALAMTIGVF